MSLILAGFVKGSTALVNNPQTNLMKWIPVPVNQVFNLSYPAYQEKKLKRNLAKELTSRIFKSIEYVPNIYFYKMSHVNLMCKITYYHLFLG